jgi:hypothetical protein
MNRQLLLVSTLVLLGPLSLNALEVERCKVRDDESPNAALTRCSTSEVLQETKEEAQEKVLAQASSAAATDSTGSRVSDSLADLLPLLQGAITPVNTSNGGVPVVLNFNTPPFLRGKTSLQATLVEPKIYSPLEEKLDAATRETESKILLDRAGGFGDATYSLGWSPIRRAKNWSTTGQLFGREMGTYEPLIDEYVNEMYMPEFTERATAFLVEAATKLTPLGDELASLLGMGFDRVMETSFASLRESAAELEAPKVSRASHLIDLIASQIDTLAALEMKAQAVLVEREKLSEKFSALVGNQPVLQVRSSYRDTDAAVGPRDLAVTVEYSAGSLNFNSLLEEYQALIEQRPDTSKLIEDGEKTELKKKAFDTIATKAADSDLWRTSYTLTYKKISDYDETLEYKLDDVTKTDSLAVPGVEEWHLRLNYSQLMGPELFDTDARPRIEFSVEGLWVEEDEDIDEKLRRHDRVLGRLTYTVPTTDNMTFPVSLVYANRPEFFAEDEDFKNRLSMHVGLSYKLPRPSDAKKVNE